MKRERTIWLWSGKSAGGICACFRLVWLSWLTSISLLAADRDQRPQPTLTERPQVEINSADFKATPQEAADIADLIRRLVEIDSPDFGLTPTMMGSQFAPVSSSKSFEAGLIMVDHQIKTSDTILKLVQFGPKAMPALLNSLDDQEKTHYTIRNDGHFGVMWYGKEVPINDANVQEHAALQTVPSVAKADPMGGGLGAHIPLHTLTRGDVCFVILGQILNRGYSAVRYQPTACQVINSPTHDPDIAKVVRNIWQSNDSAKQLFDSLLTDYCSRGSVERIQYGAAMRLLYYFPKATAGVIAERIDSLVTKQTDSLESYRAAMEANGGRADDLIKAVRFSDEPLIQEALMRLFQRSDNAAILNSCVDGDFIARHAAQVETKLKVILAHWDTEPSGPFTDEHYLLEAAAQYMPERSQELFEMYVKHGTLNLRRGAIHALMRPVRPNPWAVDFLKRFLDDQTDTKWQYGPEYDRHPIRLCDEAAQALVPHLPGSKFVLEGEPARLDEQIVLLRRRIAGEAIPASAVAPEPGKQPQDLAKLRAIEPIAKISSNESLGQVYDFSDQATVYAGHGFKARGWAYETVTINARDGKITGRTRLDEWNGGVSVLRPIAGSKALCYHGKGKASEIIVRDVRTGKEIARTPTPFHDDLGFGDPLQVRNLGDFAASAEGQWAIALTEDGALHGVEIATGKHKIVWQRPANSKYGRVSLTGNVTPVIGSNRFLVSFFGEDDPLRIWNQDDETMTEVKKVPSYGWNEAWGDWALNNMNDNRVLWNLRERKPFDAQLPAHDKIMHVLVDPIRARLFTTLGSGPVLVVDLKTGVRLAKLVVPPTADRVQQTLSTDGKLLFWLLDQTGRDPKSGKDVNPRTQIFVFDLSSL